MTMASRPAAIDLAQPRLDVCAWRIRSPGRSGRYAGPRSRSSPSLRRSPPRYRDASAAAPWPRLTSGRQDLLAAARHQRHALAAAVPLRGRSAADRPARGPASRSGNRLEHRFQPAPRKVAPPGSALAGRQQHRQRLGEPAQHHGPAERRRPRISQPRTPRSKRSGNERVYLVSM